MCFERHNAVRPGLLDRTWPESRVREIGVREWSLGLFAPDCTEGAAECKWDSGELQRDEGDRRSGQGLLESRTEAVVY